MTLMIALKSMIQSHSHSHTSTKQALRRAKLFKWGEGNAGLQWKERGVGDLRLLKHKQTGQVRSFMIL